MRALRVDGATTSLRNIPIPSAPDEVLVRVTLSGICNTDLELARGYMGFAGTIGHELVGMVEDPGASSFAKGQRVVAEINVGCNACPLCATGDSRHCPTRTVLGIVGRDGAHADYVRLPARNLIAVPDAVPDREAVFIEPLAAACGVLERCTIGPLDRVAVIGDGKLGLLCAQVLAAAGAKPVLLGKHREKLALARGIVTALVDEPAAHTFDIVVEASGSPTGFARAVELLRPLGTLVLKSTFHGTTPIDSAKLVVDEIRVVGSRCGRFAPALALLAGHAVDVSPLVSDVLSLDRGVEAMTMAARPGVLKILLAR